MTRKTKAELQAAEALTYPAKLIAALEEATQKSNYDLEVLDGAFRVRDRDSSWGAYHALGIAYSPDAQDVLDDLVWDLEAKAQQRAERERQRTLKQTALSKLTPEERSALGL
jgi:hypothetical protein